MEVLVRDEVEPCIYLPGRVARLPLRWQLESSVGGGFDRSLAVGDRRVGQAFYRPQCPSCRACETLRVLVDEFSLSRTQRRIWKRGQRMFRVKITAPTFDAPHVDLFNLHRRERELAVREGSLDAAGYRNWLVQSCCETVELRYLLEDALVAVAIVDIGATATSAVYTYFDPAHAQLSPASSEVTKPQLVAALAAQWPLAW